MQGKDLSKATDTAVFNPDPNNRIKAVEGKDGTMEYTLDGKDVPFEDGFSMSVGRDKVPTGDRPFSSFSHISQDRWDAIFKPKR
jgi:hypothetical protein